MFNLFIKIFLIYHLLIAFSNSSEITDITVNGNKRITKETIILLGKIKLEDDIDQNKLNEILKNLYDTEFFKDIELDIKNNNLLINVIENPIIENVEFVGVKSKSLTEFLYDNIKSKNQTSFSEIKLKNDLNLLRNALKSTGYYFADISSSVENNFELNSIRIKINVTTNEKAKIKKISFIGNKKLKDKNLLKIIASEENKFWKFLSQKVYLNENLINLDKRLLENYYKNLGYYDVKILNSFAEIDKKDGNFVLTYNIDAGEKFFFNNLTLNLPNNYSKEDFNKIFKLFENLSGEIYSLDNFNEILEEIDNIASSKLYDFIDINITENYVEDKLDFIFDVVDSEKYYVEKINISGNYQTVESVIRNELIVDEGDPLNKLLFNKSLDQIKSLQIFKTVNSDVNDGSSQNLKIIDIEVQEQPTGEISLAAGIGTSGSSIGGGLSEKNFLGKGINLDTNLELSEDSIKGKFSYTKPNFAYSENTLTTSAESSSSDFLSDYGYKVSNIGFMVGTEFEQYENLFFSPSFSLNFEDLETNSTATSQLKKQQGKYEDLFFNYGLNYDQRNSTYDPSKGYIASFFQEIPLYTDNGELTNTFIYTKYKTLNTSSDWVGKASVYLKTVNSLNGSDARISKRLQAPYSRLRGFEKGKVGPISNKDYIGGNYVSILNLSSNLPGILPTVEIFDFSYFIDVANVWGVDYADDIDDSSYIRSSTGIGVDFRTPIGPMNFSFSKPITKKSSDKEETFRFNLGTTF